MKLRTPGNTGELIWQGRVQLGDEPGVYGDADYAGLSFELPVTLTPFMPEGATLVVAFDLTAEGASSFGAPYLGHVVTISEFTQIPGSNPPV